MQDKPTQPIHAVTTSCNIIQTLQEENTAGVTELANQLGHSKSTIHNHLSTLVQSKMIVKQGYQYRLSLRFLEIADNIEAEFEHYDIIKSAVDKLVDETGEVVQFGIEEHGKVTYLYKSTGENGVVTASNRGGQQPIHSTALGKSILARLPEDRVDDILQAQELPKRTENTVTDPDVLIEELAQIRDRGYAIDDEENVEGLRCVAAPVMGDDSVFGALSISGPSSRFTDEALSHHLSEKIQRTANVIEINSRFS